MTDDLNEIDAILKQLEDHNEATRSQAALSLGWIGEDTKAVNALINSLLNDPSPKVRANAAMSLGQLNDKNSVKSLIEGIHDSDPFVRGMVIYSLGLMKAEKAVNQLIRVLETDMDKETRMAAAESLGQLNQKEAIMPLIRATIYDIEEDVQNEAKNSLNRLAKSLGITNIERLIEREKVEAKKVEAAKLRNQQEEKEKSLSEVSTTPKTVMSEEEKKEKLYYILTELPKLLEYAYDREEISFESFLKRFQCDSNTLKAVLLKLNEAGKINAEIKKDKDSFTVLKPDVNLTAQAKEKLMLIRKKFGIDW